MPFNGSGLFTRLHTWVNEAAASIPITASEFDEQEQDFATAGFGNCITRDGQGGPTADIPWNNFGITGLRAPVLGGDATNKTYVDAAILAQAFLTALPLQAGNADKIVTTDGATASWTALLKDGTIRFANSADTTKRVTISAASITTGTTRTLTAPNKDGTIATVADVPWVLLAPPLSITAVAALDFLTTFSATYDDYLIVGNGVTVGTTAQVLLRFAVAGVADAGANYFVNTTSGATTGASGTSMAVTQNIFAGGIGGDFVIRVSNANDAVRIKGVHADGISQINGTPLYGSGYSDGAYIAANAVSGFRLLLSGGVNFAASGTIRVYGILKQ